MQLLFLAGEPADANFTDYFEPQPEIQLNGIEIGATYVEPGHDAIAAVISGKLPDNARPVSRATMRRMRANGAQFHEFIDHQALSAHRNELAVDADSEIGTHFASPVPKEAGKSQIREFHHFGSATASELFNIRICGRQVDCWGKHHLITIQRLFDEKPRRG